MKKFILYLLLLFVNSLNAQEILKATYHNEKGEKVSPKKSDYTRIIQPTLTKGIYSFTETWKDGSLKRKGFVSEYEPKFKQTGKETAYHKNGEISTIQYIKYMSRKANIGNVQTTLSENMSVGNIQIFYENGKLKEAGEFQEPTRQNTVTRFNHPNYIVKQIADSLGNLFLDSSGTGKVNITYSNGNTVEGEYIKGLKHGQRKEFYAQNNETYIERFENGKFLDGRYIDETGKEINYDTMETFPEFKGGMQEFYKFLRGNLQYPPNMKRQRISGKVYVKFFVEKNGSLSDIEVIRGVPDGEELDDEALRVIKMSPKWNPGVQRGKPVRITYTLPIVFGLG